MLEYQAAMESQETSEFQAAMEYQETLELLLAVLGKLDYRVH